MSNSYQKPPTELFVALDEVPNMWRDYSFFIELKPRAKYASLFVDCPPQDLNKVHDKHHHLELCLKQKDFIKVSGNLVEIFLDVFLEDGESRIKNKNGEKYVAWFKGINLLPNTICALNWCDPCKRTFMCNIRANAENEAKFCRKSFRCFQADIISKFQIQQRVSQIFETEVLQILCRQCQKLFFSNSKSEFNFEVLPNDDWLDTAPSMEYFCGQACSGHGVENLYSHEDRNYGITNYSEIGTKRPAKNWFPTEKKIVFSNSFVMLLKTENLRNCFNYCEKNRLLTCKNCNSEIGTTLRTHENVYQLHMGVIDILGKENKESTNNLQNCASLGFKSIEMYFAWFFLYKSESQSSMKLLIRTYEQKPYILAWILEPHVMIAQGTLQKKIELEEKKFISYAAPNNTEYKSVSVLKILYKLYDKESAATDPRANGADSSVGIADIPYNCGLQLAEILLQSSHSLPPTLRSVGQLFVGYLRLENVN